MEINLSANEHINREDLVIAGIGYQTSNYSNEIKLSEGKLMNSLHKYGFKSEINPVETVYSKGRNVEKSSPSNA